MYLHLQVKFANGKYAIRLRDVNPYDSGLYMCIVTNDYGQLNWTVKLDVIGNTFGYIKIQMVIFPQGRGGLGDHFLTGE